MAKSDGGGQRVKMTRVYRAQSEQHNYLIPTALRPHNFSWLGKNIPVTDSIDLINTICNKSSFQKPENHFDEHSIRAYYLSLKNIISAIHNNKIFMNFALLDSD
jgi:hypothetical protein